MNFLSVNNPILFIPASHLEDHEFMMQNKMNKYAKINLAKMSKDFLYKHIIEINSERMISREFTEKEILEIEDLFG